MGGVKILRATLTSWFVIFGLLALAFSTITPLQLGAVALAAVTGVGFGLANRNKVWTLAGLYFAALGARNIADLSPAEREWQAATDGLILVLMLLGAATMWCGARPFMSSPRLRRRTRTMMTGAFLLLLAAALLDARFSSGTTSTLFAVGAMAVGVVGLTLTYTSAFSLITLLREVDRKPEAVVIIGVLVYSSLHIPGMALHLRSAVIAGSVLFSATTLVAITTTGANRVGTPLDGHPPLFTLRTWPVVLGTVAIGGAHTALRLDLLDGDLQVWTAIPVVLATGAMLFAARELSGPNKPLVVPFGRRDRALQKLPAALVEGEVRLVGQPVQRTTDSKVIGIEARLEWSNTNAAAMPIEKAAADAGLEHLLDSITLELAQAHLPAVLAGLDGDEPWLSVPLRVNAAAAEQLPGQGEVEGLVLRVSSAAVAGAIDELRDHGALLQAPAHAATDFDPEIIAVGSHDQKPTHVSLRLARASDMPSPHGAMVNLIVDDLTPPTSLAAILSRVDPANDEGVRRIDS